MQEDGDPGGMPAGAQEAEPAAAPATLNGGPAHVPADVAAVATVPAGMLDAIGRPLLHLQQMQRALVIAGHTSPAAVRHVVASSRSPGEGRPGSAVAALFSGGGLTGQPSTQQPTSRQPQQPQLALTSGPGAEEGGAPGGAPGGSASPAAAAAPDVDLRGLGPSQLRLVTSILSAKLFTQLPDRPAASGEVTASLGTARPPPQPPRAKALADSKEEEPRQIEAAPAKVAPTIARRGRLSQAARAAHASHCLADLQAAEAMPFKRPEHRAARSLRRPVPASALASQPTTPMRQLRSRLGGPASLISLPIEAGMIGAVALSASRGTGAEPGASVVAVSGLSSRDFASPERPPDIVEQLNKLYSRAGEDSTDAPMKLTSALSRQGLHSMTSRTLPSKALRSFSSRRIAPPTARPARPEQTDDTDADAPPHPKSEEALSIAAPSGLASATISASVITTRGTTRLFEPPRGEMRAPQVRISDWGRGQGITEWGRGQSGLPAAGSELRIVKSAAAALTDTSRYAAMLLGKSTSTAAAALTSQVGVRTAVACALTSVTSIGPSPPSKSAMVQQIAVRTELERTGLAAPIQASGGLVLSGPAAESVRLPSRLTELKAPARAKAAGLRSVLSSGAAAAGQRPTSVISQSRGIAPSSSAQQLDISLAAGAEEPLLPPPGRNRTEVAVPRASVQGVMRLQSTARSSLRLLRRPDAEGRPVRLMPGAAAAGQPLVAYRAPAQARLAAPSVAAEVPEGGRKSMAIKPRATKALVPLSAHAAAAPSAPTVDVVQAAITEEGLAQIAQALATGRVEPTARSVAEADIAASSQQAKQKKKKKSK